jgi:hypothetical protein
MNVSTGKMEQKNPLTTLRPGCSMKREKFSGQVIIPVLSGR